MLTPEQYASILNTDMTSAQLNDLISLISMMDPPPGGIYRNHRPLKLIAIYFTHISPLETADRNWKNLWTFLPFESPYHQRTRGLKLLYRLKKRTLQEERRIGMNEYLTKYREEVLDSLWENGPDFFIAPDLPEILTPAMVRRRLLPQLDKHLANKYRKLIR